MPVVNGPRPGSREPVAAGVELRRGSAVYWLAESKPLGDAKRGAYSARYLLRVRYLPVPRSDLAKGPRDLCARFHFRIFRGSLRGSLHRGSRPSHILLGHARRHGLQRGLDPAPEGVPVVQAVVATCLPIKWMAPCRPHPILLLHSPLAIFAQLEVGSYGTSPWAARMAGRLRHSSPRGPPRRSAPRRSPLLGRRIFCCLLRRCWRRSLGGGWTGQRRLIWETAGYTFDAAVGPAQRDPPKALQVDCNRAICHMGARVAESAVVLRPPAASGLDGDSRPRRPIGDLGGCARPRSSGTEATGGWCACQVMNDQRQPRRRPIPTPACH